MRSKLAFGVLAIAVTVALTSYLPTRIDASTGPIPQCQLSHKFALARRPQRKLTRGRDIRSTTRGLYLALGCDSRANNLHAAHSEFRDVD